MASASVDDDPIYRFGAYELNTHSRQLLRLGRQVAIQPRPFDLLAYLVRHRDRPVRRDELLAEVWRGVHVDDEALRYTLHAARRAVGDDGTRQEVIRTIPRVGFRLIAPVLEVSAPADRSMRAARRLLSQADSPFVGRDELMQGVSNLLEEVSAGAARVLLLSGEAGIGKTRAVEEISAVAQAQGMGVLRGRCVESEGAPAFWPWVQILRAAVGSSPPDALLRALATGAREVAWMVPELRPFAPDLPEAPADDARTARFLMFDAVTAFLRALAAERPFLVSIDDLHRADAASAALFLHVARELADPEAPRLLLVGTQREAELRATPALDDLLEAVAALPLARHRPMSGLAPDAVAALVRALSGRQPSAAAIAELHAKTNGNPFFLTQALRVLQSERRLAELDSALSVDLELPRHVQDAIRRQLQVLPAPTRELLETASVIGGEFGLAELALATGDERAELLTRLAPALEAGVVGERAAEHGRYRFLHALVRDVLYAGLRIDLRSQAHMRVARALERLAPEEASAASASIAHHYAQSSARDDIDEAVRHYERAARWSTSRGAFEDAAAHLGHALALVEGADPTAQRDRCRLLLALGDALGDAGARDRAREVLLDAARLARQAGLNEELATAALRFAPDLLAIETGVYDPDLVGMIEDALSALGPESSPLMAKLLARLAIAVQWSSESTRSRSLCERANEAASHLPSGEARDYVDTASTLINFSLLHPEKQLGETTRRGTSLEVMQRVLRVTSLMMLGRVRDADAEIGRFAELMQRSEYPQARWYLDLWRSSRALMEGRLADSEELAARFVASGSKYGDRNAIQSFALQTVMRAFDAGAPENLEPMVRAMLDRFPGMVGWRAGWVLLLVEMGRLDLARPEFRRMMAMRAWELARPNEWYAVVAGLALSTAALGESAAARDLYSVLLPYRDRFAVVGFGSYYLGSTQRLLSLLAASMGRFSAAAKHFKATLAANESIGGMANNARPYFEHARALRARGRSLEARRLAEKAEELASGYGMTRLAAMARALVD